MHKIKAPDDTRELKVGDLVEYRGGVRREELVENCEVVQLEAFCIASNGLETVDSIFEFTQDQDAMLAVIHAKQPDGKIRWGYWDQIALT